MTTKPTNLPPNEPDDDRLFGGLQGVVVAVLALLLVVMLGQTVYLLSYGRALRENQDALVCQWQVTQQLRNAANLERGAQRELLTVNGNFDPNESAEARRARREVAIRAYVRTLEKTDADRAAVPQCPDPRES